MKIPGVLVDMILGLDSETHSKNVVFENGKKLIYSVVLSAIYGTIAAVCRNISGHT